MISRAIKIPTIARNICFSLRIKPTMAKIKGTPIIELETAT